MIRSYKGVRPTIPATCFVDESAQIIGDVVLGEHASVWMNAVIRGDVHEIRIGAHSNVQDNSVLHGMKQQWGVYLGEYVTVGHSVTLHGCVIEDRCLIGMGSIILNGAKIGAGSIIAAGTLIPEGTVVEPGSLWMGSPGKFRRTLEAMGVEIADGIEFDDHHRYCPRELQHIAEQMAAGGATALVTTEKDAINLCDDWSEMIAPLPLYWLQIGMKIDREEEFLEAVCALRTEMRGPSK